MSRHVAKRQSLADTRLPPATTTTTAAEDSFTTLLTAAERKATHFRTLRAQIRSSLQHSSQQAEAAAPSCSSGSSSQAASLPRVRADASWARFFGETADADELLTSPIHLSSSSSRASTTGKGKEAVRSTAADSSAPVAGLTSLTPEEKAQHFGPNYLPQEDSLRNDFSQHYVDSGAGELPGNAVRNPFLATRFEEYPKLRRLVQIKEELVSAKAHAPTYLYADLRPSLIPPTQAQRRYQRAEASAAAAATSAAATGSEASSNAVTPSGSGSVGEGGPEGSSLNGSRTSSVATSLSNATSMTSFATPAPPSANTIPIPRPFHLSALMPIKYDVVIIDPPLEVYDWEGVPTRRSGASGLDSSASSSSTPPDPNQTWTWDELAQLPIPQLTAKESFVFLWVGSGAGDGLERGRELLSKWGYRRCEDIVWVRTNRGASGTVSGAKGGVEQGSTSSVLQRSVQHCLMGIRGTVRRSSDTRFVHCNVDIDVVLWEGDQEDDAQPTTTDRSTLRQSSSSGTGTGTGTGTVRDHVRAKPQEMYSLIENFCLGTRRLELFGTNRNLRRGWLTIGLDLGPHASGFPDALPTSYSSSSSVGGGADAGGEESGVKPVAYDKVMYDAHFGVDRPGCDLRERKNLLPFSSDIEALRPKSPSPRNAGAAAAAAAAAAAGANSNAGPPSHSRTGSESVNAFTPPPGPGMGLHSSPAGTGTGSWGSPAAGAAVGPSPRDSPGNAGNRSLLPLLHNKVLASAGASNAVPPGHVPMLLGLSASSHSSGSPVRMGSPTRPRHGGLHGHGHHNSASGGGGGGPTFHHQHFHNHNHHHGHPGGAGLSGLGAGGPKVSQLPPLAMIPVSKPGRPVRPQPQPEAEAGAATVSPSSTTANGTRLRPGNGSPAPALARPGTSKNLWQSWLSLKPGVRTAFGIGVAVFAVGGMYASDQIQAAYPAPSSSSSSTTADSTEEGEGRRPPRRFGIKVLDRLPDSTTSSSSSPAASRMSGPSASSSTSTTASPAQ
ncbi:hypothetical protein V8E36_008243 [Tilletia maclaganii]